MFVVTISFYIFHFRVFLLYRVLILLIKTFVLYLGLMCDDSPPLDIYLYDPSQSLFAIVYALVEVDPLSPTSGPKVSSRVPLCEHKFGDKVVIDGHYS